MKITKILNEAITWSQEQRTQSVRIKKADPRLLQLQANRLGLLLFLCILVYLE